VAITVAELTLHTKVLLSTVIKLTSEENEVSRDFSETAELKNIYTPWLLSILSRTARLKKSI